MTGSEKRPSSPHILLARWPCIISPHSLEKQMRASPGESWRPGWAEQAGQPPQPGISFLDGSFTISIKKHILNHRTISGF